MLEIRVNTKKTGYYDITKDIEEKISILDGFVYLFVPHTSCALILQENYDGSVERDLIDFLNKLKEQKKRYEHDKIDNNAFAHIASTLLNHSLLLPVENGKLMIGQWQRIILMEFDGPRERKINIKFIKSL